MNAILSEGHVLYWCNVSPLTVNISVFIFISSKKHDLFTCMNEVIHKCPGAEQTLSLTGFDLHGMERAVGILCHNVPGKCLFPNIQTHIKRSIEYTHCQANGSGKCLRWLNALHN